MRFSRITKSTTVAVLTFIMSNVPNVVVAESLAHSPNKMIATSSVLADLSRLDAEQEIKDYVAKTEVQAELLKHGISADEINLRLATLSEQEIRQLSGQVYEARAGGDILVAILLVVLIIFLVKRI